ncbi:helix-turn-helix domain-containing protein [Aeromonas media]|uniref:helix-turn-helix domain-containing protein n=1 Tax=Aeromonas TaxID=642 RepID=UPI001A1CC55D|nr:helix-turn-helix domain-containing protein [Aeromonas hydrophila]MCV9380467.1 helix-turn-helix domain-containing protein [Aeromonas hydrophila]HAT2246328.1 helix-turn-helix domain-containing protein [Aeromonas hydrophila]
MSMALMVKAMSIKVGNPLRKLVLIKLADNSSDVGECWPSYQHIADQCEISRRSVVTHIEALCEAGLLKKDSRMGPQGKRSNLYILTLNETQLGCEKEGAVDGAGDALGGAGAALPEVQEIHQGGAGAALGGGAGAAHRISHSFEPVIEPKKPPVSPKGEKSQRGTRLPENWTLPKSWGEWAMTNLGLQRNQILLEAESFADYWQSLPGAKAVKLDWEKTWRNWIRRTHRYPGKPLTRKPEPPMPRAFGEEATPSGKPVVPAFRPRAFGE